jgi:hypothetical protein
LDIVGFLAFLFTFLILIKLYKIFLLILLDEASGILLRFLEKELQVQVEGSGFEDFHAESSPHCCEEHLIEVDVAKPIANELHAHDFLGDLRKFSLGAEAKRWGQGSKEQKDVLLVHFLAIVSRSELVPELTEFLETSIKF